MQMVLIQITVCVTVADTLKEILSQYDWVN